MRFISTFTQLFTQSFPPAPLFAVDDIPDLSGKVIIVTGANTGIGKETAKALLAHNAKLYFACRNESKAREAIAELKEATGNEGIFLPLDLADLRSVKAAAEIFMSQEKELNVLFNSGGVMACPTELLSAQGYDLQFGVNVLGHFYFTKLLLPVLEQAAKNSSDGYSRVVNTASAAHELASTINFDTLKDSPARQGSGSWNLYFQSKMANVVVANEFAKRYYNRGIVSTSLNPGNLKSDLQRHLSLLERILTNALCYDVSYGALTQLYAGTMPEAVNYNGKYLYPWARLGESTPASRDPELGEKLWTWLEEQVKDL
ncbi:NAD-binding protein [Amanita rubescens]|nr:NAD-binding protein [Amanita rubescens]